MPEPTKPTHRLARITVQEVSLVDRAANQRRFLLRKKDDMKVKAKPVKKEDAATAAANVADETSDAGQGTDANSAASGGQIQQQVKEGLTQALAALAEKVVTAANAVDSLQVTDQPADPPVPDAITAQLKGLDEALDQVLSTYGVPDPDGGASDAGTGAADAGSGSVAQSADGAGTPAPGGVAEKAKAKDDEGMAPSEQEKSAVEEAIAETTAKGLDVEKNADVVVKSVAARLAINLEAAGVVVAKVGRRMAKKRLETFTKAMDMLLGLMKELRQDANPPAAATDAPAAKVGKAAAPAVPEIDAAAVALVVKSAEDVVELAKAKATENDTLRAELAKANARIGTLEKITAVSNTLNVEKASEGKPATVWPLDLNPRRRVG